jgi:hypothetical protein
MWDEDKRGGMLDKRLKLVRLKPYQALVMGTRDSEDETCYHKDDCGCGEFLIEAAAQG